MFNLENYHTKTTFTFKLKDKKGRQFRLINLKAQFGDKVEYISIEKIPGQNNKMLVRGFIRKETEHESK